MTSLDIQSWFQNNKESTLLGICPIAGEIIEASIYEAREEKFVPMFIATPRQVDADRGYTGWSQGELVEFVQNTCEELDYDGPFLVARDHGGPYQSMRDRGDPEVALEEAMDFAKEVFEKDVEEGFDILHVDATEDPRIDGILDLDEVAQRTVELISHIETVRERENRSDLYYEVGTEEITGGMTDSESFEKYIKFLKEELDEQGHEEAIERLLFVVGQVGTRMRINMTNQFKKEQAQKLVKITSKHDLFLKVHYTDWLENSDLQKFPKIGVGAANVGPEFGGAIIEGLHELENEEKEVLSEVEEEVNYSSFMRILKEVAVKKAPWKKFAPAELDEEGLEEFAENNKENIAFCVGRYVMNEPLVMSARKDLYENIREYGKTEDPNQFIIDKVKESIHRYIRAFNLSKTIP